MASLNITGLGETLTTMEKIANIPDNVIDSMLNAGADVVVKKQKKVGLRMGVHKTGVTLDSIKKSQKTGKTSAGRYIDIYPQGKNADGNRNAEVAFINEYGKEEQPARPFMRTANEEAEAEVTDAEAEVLQDWQESQ